MINISPAIWPHVKGKPMNMRELDLASEIFQEDSDSLEVLNSYMRGWISKEELADRLEFLKQVSKDIAVDRIREAEPECMDAAQEAREAV